MISCIFSFILALTFIADPSWGNEMLIASGLFAIAGAIGMTEFKK